MGERISEDEGLAPVPSLDLVPLPAERSLDRPELRSQVVRSSNREITFGFLLGYLALALHSTLRYERYAGFYVSPWIETEWWPLDEGVRLWSLTLTSRSAYRPETEIGEIVAVLSDGALEPRSTFAALGAADENADPPRRIAVRARLPRVDLVIRPVPGSAFELHAFAREVGERFRRNLD